MTVVAALLAAAGVWTWPGASATARVVPSRESGPAQRAARARAWLTRQRRVRRRERETVALIRALAAELRSGAPETVAFVAVTSNATASAGTLAPLLRPVAAAIARGAPPPAELRRLASVPGAGRLLPVAAAWDVAARYGSSMAGLLDRLADAYDDEDAVRADLAASVAGSRASMLLLAGLPLAGLALGTAVGAHPWAWLLGRPAGWAVCVVAAGLDAAGLMWTRWLLRGRS